MGYRVSAVPHQEYDPLHRPFELPVTSVQYRLVGLDVSARSPASTTLAVREPVGRAHHHPDQGASIARRHKQLAGAIGAALIRMECVSRPVCSQLRRCCVSSPEPTVRMCRVRTLSRQHCPALRHDFAAPLVAHWETLLDGAGAGSRVRLMAWGRRAGQHFELAQRAVEAAGQEGLVAGGLRTTFTASPCGAPSTSTLAHCVEAARAALGQDGAQTSLLLRLNTPLARAASLEHAVASAAAELVRWDLFDRGLAESVGIRRCEGFAKVAESAALASMRGVEQTLHLDARRLAPRRSLSTGQAVHLRGVIGTIRLEGAVLQALPWLVALAERGGSRGGFGLSQATLCLPG